MNKSILWLGIIIAVVGLLIMSPLPETQYNPEHGEWIEIAKNWETWHRGEPCPIPEPPTHITVYVSRNLTEGGACYANRRCYSNNRILYER